MRVTSKMPKQHRLFVEATRVLPAHLRRETGQANIPISPDTSLPWSEDCVHNGWSARMFLHQMLSISQPRWKPSDTESLLSRSTLEILPLRVANGNSLSDAMEATAPDSKEYYLTPSMVKGLARRALMRKRPLQRVLLRTRHGWRRKTVIVTSNTKGYVFSLPRNAKASKDFLEAGLLDFLARAVEE